MSRTLPAVHRNLAKPAVKQPSVAQQAPSKGKVGPIDSVPVKPIAVPACCIPRAYDTDKQLCLAVDLKNQGFRQAALVQAVRGLFSSARRDAPAASASIGSIDRRSQIEPLRQTKRLLREGQVYYVKQGLHGIVFAASTRTNGGKPIPGMPYSNFLFDAYRRPYAFNMHSAEVGDAWLEAYHQDKLADIYRDLEAFRTHVVRALDVTCKKMRQRVNLTEADRQELAEGEALLVTRKASYAQYSEDFAFKVDSMLDDNKPEELAARDCLVATLDLLKNGVYPTIDLFLHALSARLSTLLRTRQVPLPEDETYTSFAWTIARTSYEALGKANGLPKGDGREIWPIEWSESRRSGIDQKLILMADNLRVTYSPNTYDQWDVDPLSKLDPGIVATRKRMPGVHNMLNVAPQAVCHEALRNARHSFLMGEWWIDERMQRNIAVRADAVARKPLETAALRAQRTEQVRAKALQTIDEQLTAHPPAALAAILMQRRRAIVAARDFPYFSSVPWLVTAKEAAAVRDANACYFTNLPYGQGPRQGNCNSIAFTLLHAAAQEEARLHKLPKPPRLVGPEWLFTFGAHHLLKLPRPKVQ